MAAEVIVHPPYTCPACGERLEAAAPGWSGWLLCPRCGSPGLPPAGVRIAAPSGPPAPAPGGTNGPAPAEDAGAPASPLPLPLPRDGASSRPARPRPRRPARAIGTARWIGSSGLAVSAFLLLVSYLDRKTLSMAVFGGLAAAFALFLAVLGWMSRRAAARESSGGEA
ncbi:hypothetical protein OJF2_10370 [Aquisphaera giovannonii]|uniref:Uncharacterized protein n=1 Tax=Aquisphaera giovannonii TaxID=406548 RepID=A0A5B9VY67_9BACT|nr:hypothetical protein [Aquisphaera giovannonii]QEH32560.1 hypothetical protein OJF2_10370 [Aquisphaera giovannonii]